MRNISRRQFVRQSTGALATVALGLSGFSIGCRTTGTLRRVIDVHIHADFRDRVLQSQAQNLSRVDYSVQGLRSEMRRNNVESAISIGFEMEESELSREAPNPVGLDSLTPDLEGLGNIHLIAGINPYRLDREGVASVKKALETKRIKGLKIYLGYYYFLPDDDIYKQVYELAEIYGIPVIFHTGDTYSANAKVRYAHPLRIDDVAVDFRDVKFVLAHLGNPWTMDAAELLYKNRNVYGDLSGFLVGDEAYFSDKKNAEGIEHVVERIKTSVAWVENPKKFLYGSDWPLVPMKPYLELMKRAIRSEFHEQVFYLNAKEVFDLP